MSVHGNVVPVAVARSALFTRRPRATYSKVVVQAGDQQIDLPSPTPLLPSGLSVHHSTVGRLLMANVRRSQHF